MFKVQLSIVNKIWIKTNIIIKKLLCEEQFCALLSPLLLRRGTFGVQGSFNHHQQRTTQRTVRYY